MTQTDDEKKLWGIFAPHTLASFEKMTRENTRFVHYTTAEVAMSILLNKEVWMRNAVVMNDFSEIEHGKDCLFHAYKSEAGLKLQSMLNTVEEGLSKRLEDLFNGWIGDIGTNTYVTSLSEHRGGLEDTNGRLSMWRAYGRGSGVALVLNNEAFRGDEQSVNIFSGPILYATIEQFSAEFSTVVNGLVENADLVLKMQPNDFLGYAFQIMRIAVMYTKHPAFHEEAEWRITYSPGFEKSDVVIEDHKIIGGIPQRIYKIPLKNPEGKGVSGWDIPQLLDRIVIGPTEFPLPIFQELVRALEICGVDNARDKVVVSGIPLRG